MTIIGRRKNYDEMKISRSSELKTELLSAFSITFFVHNLNFTIKRLVN